MDLNTLEPSPNRQYHPTYRQKSRATAKYMGRNQSIRASNAIPVAQHRVAPKGLIGLSIQIAERWRIINLQYNCLGFSTWLILPESFEKINGKKKKTNKISYVKTIKMNLISLYSKNQ